jgi:tetratricopeptide (TPR) repeat protein
MNLFSWLTDAFSVRGKALSFYRRGMGKMKRGDMAGAIADYTSVIDLAGVPDDVKAMALFNRGLAYHKAKNHPQAAADFDAVLEMPGAPPDIKGAAREKQTRWNLRDQRRAEKLY